MQAGSLRKRNEQTHFRNDEIAEERIGQMWPLTRTGRPTALIAIAAVPHTRSVSVPQHRRRAEAARRSQQQCADNRDALVTQVFQAR